MRMCTNTAIARANILYNVNKPFQANKKELKCISKTRQRQKKISSSKYVKMCLTPSKKHRWHLVSIILLVKISESYIRRGWRYLSKGTRPLGRRFVVDTTSRGQFGGIFKSKIRIPSFLPSISLQWSILWKSKSFLAVLFNRKMPGIPKYSSTED